MNDEIKHVFSIAPISTMTLAAGLPIMDRIIADTEVFEQIESTNNGKLLLTHFTDQQREHIKTMRKDGQLLPANFMRVGDSVRITDSWVERRRTAHSNQED